MGAARRGDVERELMLELVRTSDSRLGVAARIGGLAETADFCLLAAALRASRLLPLLGSRLLESVPDVVPDAFREQVQVATQHGRHRATLVEQIAQRLAGDVERAGVPVVMLKGPHLAERLHGDASMRDSTDIDLLVRPEDFHAATRTLTCSGYHLRCRAAWERGLPLFETSLRPPQAWMPPIDLHWRLHWYEDGFSREFVEHCRVENGFRVPTPVDELVSLLLFWCRDGLVGLRHAADVAAWWDRFGGSFEPAVLDETVQRHPPLERALSTAVLHASSTTGLPAEQLLSRPAGRRLRLAARVGSMNAVSRSEADACVVALDTLVTPPHGKRAFVRRHFLPPGPVIADIYGLAPRAHTRRMLRHAYFAGRALTRILPAGVACLARAIRVRCWPTGCARSNGADRTLRARRSSRSQAR